MHPRLHLDIHFKDLAAGIGSFVPGAADSREKSVEAIQALWPCDRAVLVVRSVRTAFDLLLQALALPPDSEILMSAVNIENMAEIAVRHGLIPVPIDLDLATLGPKVEQLAEAISPKSRLLLIAHLFGSTVDLRPYAMLCQQHNLLLVEDCAQTFAGIPQPMGKEADVSLFSFGPIKSCTALGGAIALFRDRTLAKMMEGLEEQYPTKSEWGFLVRLLKYGGLKFLSQPWVYHKLLAMLQLLGRDRERTINGIARGFAAGDLLAKIRHRPPLRMLMLLRRRLETCSGYEGREAVARDFLSKLDPQIDYPGSKAPFHSFWVVPLIVKQPEELMKTLWEAGFDATQGSTSLRAIPPHSNVPNAVYLLQHLLYLPMSASLSENERSRLAEIVNRYEAQ